MRPYIEIPPNGHWKNIDVHGEEAKRVLHWLRRQRQGRARQPRFTVCRSRDHRGLHVRLTVKFLSRLRREIKGLDTLRVS